jgi:aspartate/glutamate racemase
MKKIKIGVLGGIGPEATGEFYNKLISKLQDNGMIKSNSDFPQIIINRIPAPELIDHASESDIEQYRKGIFGIRSDEH